MPVLKSCYFIIYKMAALRANWIASEESPLKRLISLTPVLSTQEMTITCKTIAITISDGQITPPDANCLQDEA